MSASEAVLPPGLRLGAVHLTVADLDRSLGYYRDRLGLRVHRREDAVAALGTGEHAVVLLHEEPGARPAGRHAGLFHYALLFPSREELARALGRLAASRTPLTGASDHGVSEALYLRDPDGHGIELYADRPPQAWPPPQQRGDRVGMFTRALDLDDLIATIAGEEPAAHPQPGLRMGHVHLQVGDLGAARGFYVDVLGLEPTVASYPGAMFLAAGGYHHHVGINTWAGEGIGPAPPGTARLREWTLVLEADAIAALRRRIAAAGIRGEDGDVVADPWGIAVRFG